jgi:hypothetical protein
MDHLGLWSAQDYVEPFCSSASAPAANQPTGLINVPGRTRCEDRSGEPAPELLRGRSPDRSRLRLDGFLRGNRFARERTKFCCTTPSFPTWAEIRNVPRPPEVTDALTSCEAVPSEYDNGRNG